MARRAIETQGASVPVAVTRAALRRHVYERRALVARVARLDEPRVASRKRKAGLGGVIEGPRVERLEVRVRALVFRVAASAVARHLAVHALPRGHPLRDRLVTAQAAGWLGGARGGVALQAAGTVGRHDAGVRTRERPRHLAGRLCESGRRGKAQGHD
jgi:hypothetical protein